MLAAIVRGFLLGPVVVVVVALLLANAAAVGWVVLAVVVGLLAWGLLAAFDRRQPMEPVPTRDQGDAVLTSIPGEVRATARENLASDNRWRRAFIGWRYGSPPKRD